MSLELPRRSSDILWGVHPTCRMVEHLPNEKGPFLRLDALDYRRQCDEGLAAGTAISRRWSNGTRLHQHSHSDSRLHADYTAGIGKSSHGSVAGKGHFRYGGA
jgi:hypothetical protein